MPTRLQEILDKEGISKAEMGRLKGLNPTTIYHLCKDSKYHQNTRVRTKNNVLIAIEELGRSKKKYKIKDVFPE
jgi:hypothetical protein